MIDGATIDNSWQALGLALALGLLVGIQRGWVLREQAEGTRFAGVRTHGLLGLAAASRGHFISPTPRFRSLSSPRAEPCW